MGAGKSFGAALHLEIWEWDIPHPFASRRSWIDSDANEEIDIADSAGSSLKMSSSFTMQRATDALLDYWIIDCYQKLLVRFRLELKLQSWHSNSP